MTQVGTTGTGTSVGGGMSAAGSAVNARADALVADARRTMSGVAYVDTEGLARTAHASGSTALELAVQARLTPTQRGEFARAIDRADGPAGSIGQIMGANGDFLRNYDDMRTANTIGADKYFHCKANFEAAQRGEYGGGRAAVVSDAREWVDQHVKGDPAAASAADQRANHWGRAAAYAHPGMLGREACDVFRPRGLDARY